jgi:hypothetical protein
MVVDDAKTLWGTVASAYKSTLKLNIFEIREDLSRIRLQDCEDVDIYASRIDREVKDLNLCAGPIAPSNAGTDAADTDANAKTITAMSEQEHIVYLRRGITPNEIVTKLVEKEAAIKRENGLAPEAQLFAKKGGKGGNGGSGSKAGKGSKSPRRDK